MELLEDVYVNELIDAFDAPEAEYAAPSTELSGTHRQHRNACVRHSTPSSAQELCTEQQTTLTTLSPAFDYSCTLETPPGAPVRAARASSEAHQQQETMRSQEFNVPLSSQMSRGETSMTDTELQRERQQIEREMRMYQARFDHVVKALAGGTSHQIQARKQRGEEQSERREKRVEAVETRLLHQLECLEGREQRRTRVYHKRQYRASRSSSPGTAKSHKEHEESIAKESEKLELR
uniref:Uncharacterized protein n=1 Tax=Hyaloperonospora arabidopsidis (strain Emoy2) TaxID=559515 RepID=M4BAF7_HYAAE